MIKKFKKYKKYNNIIIFFITNEGVIEQISGVLMKNFSSKNKKMVIRENRTNSVVSFSPYSTRIIYTKVSK